MGNLSKFIYNCYDYRETEGHERGYSLNDGTSIRVYGALDGEVKFNLYITKTKEIDIIYILSG